MTSLDNGVNGNGVVEQERRQGAMAISSLLSEDNNKPSANGHYDYDPSRKMSLSTITTKENDVPPHSPSMDDDMNFNYYGALDGDENNENGKLMNETKQWANQPRFADEKEGYLRFLQSKIDSIVSVENEVNENHFESQFHHALQKYETRADMMRKKAQVELEAYARYRVQKQEEAELKEKRRILKRLERQRKKQDAAAAAAAANKLLPGDSEDGATPKTKRRRAQPKKKETPAKTTTKATKGKAKGKGKGKAAAAATTATAENDDGKKPGRQTRKRKISSQVAGDEDTPSRTTRIKLNNGSAATPSKESAKKDPKVKPPSNKEIRALARQYNNVYESIWKDIARREAPKASKQLQAMVTARQSNLRKTVVLASKEARRWQFRTNKNYKDLQARARRGLREMLAFWRRNEREERELRKKAEKEKMDQLKREEEAREARRQERKLNFLITQTELYSHFIGKKIKTSEVAGEDQGDQVDHGPVDVSHASDAKDLDFENAEDEDLKKAAMANAHNAVMDAQARARQFNQAGEPENNGIDIDSDEMNFQNPTSLNEMNISQPKMLSCQLKEYQLKGLNWLASLYEQGINGILADEMGLGKTVQSISVMAYLAETHNIWGPFLVIAPSSTLHNWQQEISKFVPEFNVLPYWGNSAQRKTLRKFLDRKQLTYGRDAQFHVLITSYQLVVQDAQYLQRMKWQYMILDEAQAIKSSSSSRWKNLLSFHCRNRLLLTGTPIQNSMQELWALLHFIMPSIFDSHEEFSDWFSKDIESHAQTNSQLNQAQLKRLHMILKPFMLRRVKKHVQQELGDKIEIDVYCDLTNRQRTLYKMLRSQINIQDLIERAASGSEDSNQSLMNLVMQFRKVCNHPDLFERADVRSSFNFATFAQTLMINRDPPVLELEYSAKNRIEFALPKLMYFDGGFLDVPGENSLAGSRYAAVERMFNIWKPSAMKDSKSFDWVAFSGTSLGEISKLGRQGVLERALDRFHAGDDSAVVSQYDDGQFTPADKLFLISERKAVRGAELDRDSVLYDLYNVASRTADDRYYRVTEKAYGEPASCPPIHIYSSSRAVLMREQRVLYDQRVRAALRPMTLDQEWSLLKSGVKPADFPPSNLFPQPDHQKAGFSSIKMPSMSKFVTQSGKLAQLDRLLTELKANDHRVLIYFQMTRMMDLMEEYLTFRQHKYVRLDGSSKLSDRRDLVNDWQTRPELFVFLLSTRAGGLGINLTAADTVIFYDSDWNPTIDSQAMDRAHRLGQTRQVTVYRLLVKGTIEERMRDRAKQKEQVQHVVMEGNAGAQNNVDFKEKPGREVVHWLLQDDDANAVDEAIRQKEEREARENAAKKNGKKSKKQQRKMSLEEMYHEGEGNFEESNRPSEIGTPVSTSGTNTPVPKNSKR